MKIMYMGASPEEETTFQGVRYIFPKGLAVDVPQALIDDGILNDPDFEAADEEAMEYVPVQPTTRSGMWLRSNGRIETDNGTEVPVVSGGHITSSDELPESLDAGDIHLTTNAAGVVTDLSLAPGTGFGTVVHLDAAPVSLAADQVAAVTNAAGVVTDLYFGASS